MKYAFAHKKLMAPGPVPMPTYVQEIFAACNAHHRTADFQVVLRQCLARLRAVFQTREHCYILPSTGTGAMEAAVVNTLNTGDSVLVVEGGKFRERWGHISRAYGLDVRSLQVPWGEAVLLNQVKAQLGPQTKALMVQACETSTGVAHPIKELGELCAATDTMLMVDGITAVAAYDVPMDRWGIDVLLGGSQKGFMLPTGTSFLALSEKAQEKQALSTLPKFYWDLSKELASNKKGLTQWSTPSQLVLALNSVLEDILETQGLEKHFATVLQRAQIFREAVQLPSFCESPSPSLSCLKVPEGKSAVAIKSRLYDEFDISIVAGQDKIKDRILRVGHMGAMSHGDLLETAAAINQCLQD